MSWVISSQIWSKALLIFLHEWNRNIVSQSCSTGFRTGEGQSVVWTLSSYRKYLHTTWGQALSRTGNEPRTTCTRIGSDNGSEVFDPMPKGSHGAVEVHCPSMDRPPQTITDPPQTQAWTMLRAAWCSLQKSFWLMWLEIIILGKNAKAKHFLCPSPTVLMQTFSHRGQFFLSSLDCGIAGAFSLSDVRYLHIPVGSTYILHVPRADAQWFTPETCCLL